MDWTWAAESTWETKMTVLGYRYSDNLRKQTDIIYLSRSFYFSRMLVAAGSMSVVEVFMPWETMLQSASHWNRWVYFVCSCDQFRPFSDPSLWIRMNFNSFIELVFRAVHSCLQIASCLLFPPAISTIFPRCDRRPICVVNVKLVFVLACEINSCFGCR